MTDNKKNMTFTISIIAAILTAIFAIVSTITQNIEKKRDDTERAIIDRDLKDKTTYIAVMQEKLIDTSRYIIKLQEDLNKANEKIINLQDTIMLEVTGGKGIPMIGLTSRKSDTTIYASFYLSNNENIAIHDIRIKIVDFGSIKESEFSYNSLRPGSLNYVTTLDFSSSIQDQQYVISIDWRNGHYTCEAHYKPDNTSGMRSFDYYIYYKGSKIPIDKYFKDVKSKKE
ncbi:MAG: hypothetical protein RL204_810 [Bacteroidota bacterium]|jgi:hypothetical protein